MAKKNPTLAFSMIVSSSRHIAVAIIISSCVSRDACNGKPFLTAHEPQHAFDQPATRAIEDYDGADHYRLPVSGKQRRIIGRRSGIPHGKQVGENMPTAVW